MELVTGVAVAITTLAVALAGALVAGFVVLFRRRGDAALQASSPSDLGALETRASGLLVRLDDAVREADDELGFAIAQFGAEKSRGFGEALGAARGKVAEAFRLRQALDDAVPDSDRQRREWTLQIIALCEQAESALTQQESTFRALRRSEVNAAQTLAELTARIDSTDARIPDARQLVARLSREYAASVVAAVRAAPDDAERALASARTRAAAISVNASGVNAVSDALDDAAQTAHRADQALDALERAASSLDAARLALEKLRADTRDDLEEARTQRDAAPDADTARGIIDAMAEVENALTAPAGSVDPFAELDRIGAAVASLDLALASARNQADRLSHARAAYESTLVSATSQLAVVRDYIGSRGAGVSARTRLAEAERQYSLATTESDPVEALDIIRRAVTLARDADTLAR
jgi:DNA repair exonuclease SbcCD ATPase subunit